MTQMTQNANIIRHDKNVKIDRNVKLNMFKWPNEHKYTSSDIGWEKLAEWLLPTLEDPGLNPVICNQNGTFFLLTLLKNKIKKCRK